MNVITCKQLSLGYENQPVIKNINFSLKTGDFLCVVGENGSGKSTLIKGLLGFLKPLGGEIMLSDDVREKGIGYLPQQTAAQKNFPATVMEVVLSGCLKERGWRPFYSQKEKQKAIYHLGRLKMDSLKNNCYCDLSGGQQQRVLIARALCATNDLLLLDEPATGLDPSATAELYEILQYLNIEENVTIIMVSHDIHNAIRYASHILQIEEEVKFFGPAADYQSSEAKRELTGGGI